MATQGYEASVSFNSSDITGANSVTFTINGADLDITAFGEESMRRLVGLFDHPVSVSGHFDNSDAGLSALITASLGRTAQTVEVLLDAAGNGYSVSAHVFNLEFEASVDGIVNFSAELGSTGDVTQVTP